MKNYSHVLMSRIRTIRNNHDELRRLSRLDAQVAIELFEKLKHITNVTAEKNYLIFHQALVHLDQHKSTECIAILKKDLSSAIGVLFSQQLANITTIVDPNEQVQDLQFPPLCL